MNKKLFLYYLFFIYISHVIVIKAFAQQTAPSILNYKNFDDFTNTPVHQTETLFLNNTINKNHLNLSSIIPNPIDETEKDFGVEEPEPSALERPKHSIIPKSGVYLDPWPGLATEAVPSISAYNGHDSFHRITLDDLTGKEAISSWLLPAKWDSQRHADLPDPYYMHANVTGHLIPQMMPFREKLQKKGFVFSLSYKAEAMADIYGGQKRGMDYVHEVTFQMNFDLGRLAGWNGWSIHSVMLNRVGNEVSHRVGEYNVNLAEVYGYSGHAAVHLADIYAEKNLFNNHLDVAFGRMSVTHVFGINPLLCTYMMNCSAPPGIKSNPDSSVYPKASWGGRIFFRPTRDTSIKVGAYQVRPNTSDPKGWSWKNETTTGLTLPIELTWHPFLTRNRLMGHYVLGFVHDTSHYPDLLGSANPSYINPHIHLHKSTMDTFYFEGNQMIYRRGGRNQMAGGYILAGYIHNTPHTANIEDNAYCGLSFNGLFKGRLSDRFGILYSWYHISSRKKLGQIYAQNAGFSLGHGVLGPQTSSQAIESYYSIDAHPGLIVQPEFEYMIHPGETHYGRDAALFGLKVIGNL